jgi:peptide/nickel transport system substrate-binding protein
MQTSSHAQKSADTLRVAQSFPLETIDPYYSSYLEVFIVVGEMVFDSLVFADPKTGEAKPLLSTSFKWLDTKTLTFDLRQGVTWHDGKPFTSADVIYTFNYILDPANRTIRREYYDFIDKVTAEGDYKVTFHFKRPFGPTMQMMNVLPILPVDFFGKGGVAGGNGRLVGTGPYKIEQFTPGAGVKLIKNDKYFTGSPKGTPSIGRFEYKRIPEASAQVSELVSGGVDWVWRLTPDDLKNVARSPRVATEIKSSMRLNFISFDVEGKSDTKAVTDLRVRRAVAHAINRKTLVAQLVGGSSGVQHQPCVQAQFGCPDVSDVVQYDYDPGKAKALLAEAGYPNGLELTLWVIDNRPPLWAAAVQADLKAVGIKANIRLANAKILYEATATGSTPMFFSSFGSTVRDVSQMWIAFFGTGSLRDLAHDRELTAWVDEGGVVADPEERKNIYKNVARRLMERLYWFPLWVEPTTYAYNKDLNYRAFDDENPRFYLSSWK